MNQYIYTDLTLEVADSIGLMNNRIYLEQTDVYKSKIEITQDELANQLGKPKGTYLTLEANSKESNLSKELSNCLVELLPKTCKTILVAGLGNENATPDALGPKVVSKLTITRKIYGKDQGVLAIEPGVLAQTGMETIEILKGIIKEVKPDVLVVVDALAARSISRIGRTIQLTDTGIEPGSGVGNYQKALTKKTLNLPVIAIGVPTVIGAGTLVCDIMEQICGESMDQLDELIPTFYVTPKDVDEMVDTLSATIASSLNKTFKKLIPLE
ncbi:Endopeptidase spore protease Gpr [Lachnospiraceae bacterium TWA4]|nr:Endopeptidase spore protease Gpr [Lachnospiraceae bacterium TWA4]